ncbi:MAG: PadR family transcriptional regulator [Longicatena sp.]
MIPSQMLKGILDSCILQVIQHKETYGYEISLQLKEFGFGEISEGTIYPLLLRLEKNGLIKAVYRESALGPKRKYFSLTSLGEQELFSFVTQWNELRNAVDALNGGYHHE